MSGTKKGSECGETYLPGSTHENGKFLELPLKDLKNCKESSLENPIEETK
jgi:hypothetical protein